MQAVFSVPSKALCFAGRIKNAAVQSRISRSGAATFLGKTERLPFFAIRSLLKNII
jgi:hypothetical protein